MRGEGNKEEKTGNTLVFLYTKTDGKNLILILIEFHLNQKNLHMLETNTFPTVHCTKIQTPTGTALLNPSNFHWVGRWVVFLNYLLNHIQCRDWMGARPHLEFIAADATQHKEMGCSGGGQMGRY